MDRIKLFYSNLDTQPKVLIEHFMRYLGFYVEEIVGNTEESDVESLFDIYIISDAYVDEKSSNLDIKSEWKTIMVYMDGWWAGELKDVRAILYERQKDSVFLKQLCRHVVDMISTRTDIFRRMRLIGNCGDLGLLLNEFIQVYTDYNVLQMALFARCFYAQRDFFWIAYGYYRDFIQKLEDPDIFSGDLADYMHLMACYEMDMICKVNSFELYYEPYQLLEECEKLLRKYVDNEELHLIQADIDMQLIGIWNKAGNEYADIRLHDCAYAYLWQGNILRIYVRNRRAAIEMYEEAIQRKEDYFQAWFWIGECYWEQMKYIEAIEAYEKVLEILEGRYRGHVLAPHEMAFMYETAMKIAGICRVRLKVSRVAKHYDAMAEDIWEEVRRDRYFKCVWRDETAFVKYFGCICDELDDRLCRIKEEAEERGEIYYGERRI